jgi:hypothetical protein
MITTKPDAFGEIGQKEIRWTLRCFWAKAMASTPPPCTTLKKKFDDVDNTAKAMLGPIQSEAQWNFLRYANESAYGINTIVKEGNNVGKVTIFSRTVITDHDQSGKYWDKGTSIKLDKATGKFTAPSRPFATPRRTPTSTSIVNGAKTGDVQRSGQRLLAQQGLSLYESHLDHPRRHPGRHLFFHDRCGRRHAHGGLPGAVVKTAGPVGINAANVLKPSNMALTLFSPLGSFLPLRGGGTPCGLAGRPLLWCGYFHRLHLAGQIRFGRAAHEGLQGMAGQSWWFSWASRPCAS